MKKNYFIPDYPWELVKTFLFHKKHPVAKLLKRYSLRYHRPQIFMSRFYKLRTGMFVEMGKPCLQIIPYSLENTMTFWTFLKVKQAIV